MYFDIPEVSFTEDTTICNILKTKNPYLRYQARSKISMITWHLCQMLMTPGYFGAGLYFKIAFHTYKCI